MNYLATNTKYQVTKKKNTYILERISDGVKIKNLTPYEAYQILDSDKLPNKIVEFMERINNLPNGCMMSGQKIKEMFNEGFRSALEPAADFLDELEKICNVDNNNSSDSDSSPVISHNGTTND